MMHSVSIWRCKCGARINALGEGDQNQPLATAVAECPTCGDKQAIYAARILSVTREADEAAQPQTSE
jgi:hypothetical protein